MLRKMAALLTIMIEHDILCIVARNKRDMRLALHRLPSALNKLRHSRGNMMKKFKLFLTFATVFAITLLLLVIFTSALEIVYDGSYGDVTWKLYSSSGKLVVSGTGEIEDLTYILTLFK